MCINMRVCVGAGVCGCLGIDVGVNSSIGVGVGNSCVYVCVYVGVCICLGLHSRMFVCVHMSV